MNQPNPGPPAKAKPRRRSNTSWYVIAALLAVLALVLGYAYLSMDTARLPWSSGEDSRDGAGPATGQASLSPESGAPGQPNSTDPREGSPAATGQGVGPGGEPGGTAEQKQSGGDGQPWSTGPDGSADADPQTDVVAMVQVINDFYDHLDRQPYMQHFALPEPSRVYFPAVLGRVLANPPVVTRETDDLYTLLRNTAHFFRVLGQEDMFILKGILDRERASLEPLLKTFYALTYHPQVLKEEYNLELPLDNLYDYGAFFLHTMGGRLYLFRRDSTSRMVVSYYAILVVDRANLSGESRHGIDLLPSIDALIEEIENGGNRLTYREEYLDHLYDLKEKYDNRYSSEAR